MPRFSFSLIQKKLHAYNTGVLTTWQNNSNDWRDNLDKLLIELSSNMSEVLNPWNCRVGPDWYYMAERNEGL